MAKNIHPSVKYTKPEGGMFVWVTLPNGVDMMKFVGEALENKVALVPGTAFLADTSMPCQSFRMNFFRFCIQTSTWTFLPKVKPANWQPLLSKKT